MIGQTLSHYKITSKLGEGGMGEVYRATDTKLNRDVALKVLPEAFAADRERMARFSREAQVLASLNHPNIATIHGLEEADGKQALVLELVEGEDLSERIKRGAIPLEESLKIVLQMAEALEAAHEKGIIHRDLKPANVKITPEGKVKVLDFGLAKALEDEIPAADLTHSPTRTDQMTNVGVIMGTAGYMSPEQARGQPVDKRTDIWAFGCVLYEVLTGKQVFGGETVTDILAAIVHNDPNWEALPEGTPRAIQRLLRRCLEKDPHDRLHDIADARIEIRHALSEPSDHSPGETATATSARWKQPIPVAAVGLLMVLIGVLLGFLLWNPEKDSQPAPPTVTRFPIVLPEDEVIPAQPSLALSPDGTQLVYAAVRDNTRRLYLRGIDQLEVEPIPGTEGGWGPFFSLDGKWVGFFTNPGRGAGVLKKWSLLGGEPVTICEVGIGRGASWGEDGTIIFGRRPGLWQVPASGGTPEPLIPEGTYHNPQILPEGKGVLLTIAGSGVGVFSLDTGQQSILVEGASKARYLPTGHLVYAQGASSLLAAPFDLDSLEPRGPGVSIVDDVWVVLSVPKFEVSQSGSLVYVPGADVDPEDALVWVDRDGKQELFLETQMNVIVPRLSPNGSRLAVTAEKNGPEDFGIWTCDIERCVLSPLTPGIANVWSPDGADLFLYADDMIRIPADGSGEPELLLKMASLDPTYRLLGSVIPSSCSPDGKVLAFGVNTEENRRVILTLRLDGNSRFEPFQLTQFSELHPVFSPDGNWIAFTSDRSGRNEIYAKRYPAEGGLLRISTEGGTRPLWSPDGKEIFYRNGAKMMVVVVQGQQNLRAGKPRELFEWPRLRWPPARHYDVTPDGQRFVMVKRREEPPRNQIHVVVNWFGCGSFRANHYPLLTIG